MLVWAIFPSAGALTPLRPFPEPYTLFLLRLSTLAPVFFLHVVHATPATLINAVRLHYDFCMLSLEAALLCSFLVSLSALIITLRARHIFWFSLQGFSFWP